MTPAPNRCRSYALDSRCPDAGLRVDPMLWAKPNCIARIYGLANAAHVEYSDRLRGTEAAFAALYFADAKQAFADRRRGGGTSSGLRTEGAAGAARRAAPP